MFLSRFHPPRAACAPQPTEDSSSSPADGVEHYRNDRNYGGGGGAAGGSGTGAGGDAILSDSDDRQELKLSLNTRQSCMFGNFESDSLNETTTFSSARPNPRRKRKFKRIAIEHETTPSTPGTSATGSFALHATGAAEAAAAAASNAAAALLAAGAAPSMSGAAAATAFGIGFGVNCGASTSTASGSNVATGPAAAAAAVGLVGGPAAHSAAAGCSISSSAAAAVAAASAAAAAAGSAGAIKKRTSLKHGPAGGQAENFRANLFFCGKRKRSHRDRYYEQHSSSVPRQRDRHAGHQAHGGAALQHPSPYHAKNSYSEYRSRNRSFSSALPKSCERIMPLNNSIVSRIEKISQDSRTKQRDSSAGYRFDEAIASTSAAAAVFQLNNATGSGFTAITASEQPHRIGFNVVPTADALPQMERFGAGAAAAPALSALSHPATAADGAVGGVALPRFTAGTENPPHFNNLPQHHQHNQHQQHHAKPKDLQPQHPHQTHPQHHHHHHHNHNNHYAQPPNRKVQRRSNKRQQFQSRLQFDDPNAMDAQLAASGSSSSMSSSESDSEAAQRNDTDREGDDELTDWPGNEAMVNFTSKNDFKRQAASATSTSKTNRQLVKSATGGGYNASPVLKSEEPVVGAVDDDTLMAADEMCPAAAGIVGGGAIGGPPNTLPLFNKFGPSVVPTVPIAIQGSSSGGGGGSVACGGGGGSSVAAVHGSHQPLLSYQVESEMSGETSNNFLSSPSFGAAAERGSFEVREIRAGCRRIHDERPGFSILTSINEELSK